MGIRVYKYGLLAPVEGAEELDNQLWLASRYYNKLIELERKRRDAVRVFDDGPALSAVEEAAAARLAAENAIKKHRAEETYKTLKEEDGEKKVKKVRKTPRHLQAALTEAKTREKEARSRLRDAREQLRSTEDYQECVKEAREQFDAELKEARKSSEVYSGTYQLVESAFSQAKKVPMWKGAHPQDPRFRRHKKGVGSVGVQIVWNNRRDDDGQIIENNPPPVTAETAMSGVGSKVYLTEGEPRKQSKRGKKRPFMKLHLRVASDENRKPVWVVFPMVLHRPLPPQCAIKRVDVHCTLVGRRRYFEVCFLVVEKPEAITCGQGAVGVDLGWRALEEGDLRVAVARDEEGRVEEAYANPEAISNLRFVDQLRSIRDRSRDDMQKKLVDWLRTRDELPEWMLRRTVRRDTPTPSNKQACAYISGWKASARFATLAFAWKGNRFDGDEMAYGLLEAWRKQDAHVWERETSLRRRSLNRRLDDYRVWADKLAQKYSTLILDDVDLSAVAKNPEVQDDGDNEHSRTNRQRAAVYTLRLALINAFLRRGAGVFVPLTEKKCTPKKVETLDNMSIDIIPVEDGFDKTRCCSDCGTTLVFDRAKQLWVECSFCGIRWDQDVNAAQNLLGVYVKDRERFSAVQNRRVARDREKGREYGGPRLSRKEKNELKRKQREQENETSRNTSPKAL